MNDYTASDYAAIKEAREKSGQQLSGVLEDIKFPEYEFVMEHDPENRRWHLYARYLEPDTITKVVEWQKTRKWVISQHMTRSEFAQTAFKCVLTSMEHRVREHFKYRGQPVYMPHYDVDALHELCVNKAFDYRVDNRD